MFLADLNEDQKRSFLHLAHRITAADGEDSEDEHEALEALCGEMGIPFSVEMSQVVGDIDTTAFDTHRARVIASLELMCLVYADDYVHEAEVAEVAAICRNMDFPDEWIGTMAEWARRLSWSEEAPDDAERARYKAELLAYAHHIMKG